MQSTETVLNVIQKRGSEGKPLERLYRQLFNKDIYRLAYSKIYSNKGAVTPGIGNETLDEMSEQRIDKIIEKIRTETYRWKPVRRTYIPKKQGGKRPLGIPSGNDKLLQTAMKILIETYYEPRFSNRSHGFRPERGCHTALQQLSTSHRNTSWFIEGDIKGCLDNIDQQIMFAILAENIHDGRFLRLVKHLMESGYIEDWKWEKTLSGTPQGGIISPLLSNIYLDKFDQWVEKELLPQYNYGSEKDGYKTRRRNPEYRHYEYKRREAKNKRDEKAYKHYGKMMKQTPSIVDDEGYRKLEYIRYADDFLLSFQGPKKEAEEIREYIRSYLERELNLELSIEKTLITHAKTEKARFLGYDICVMQSNERKTANGQIWFGIPKEVIKRAISKYSRNNKPIHRAEWLLNSDYDIVVNFQAEYSGLVQYYIMAHNVHNLKKLEWVASTSLLKTLAGKHKTTVGKVAKRHKATISEEGKTYRVFKATVEREGKSPLIAYFGAIPLKRNPKPQKIADQLRIISTNRSEILDRMQKNGCEMCGKKGPIEVHHVRSLKDLNKPGKKQKPVWIQRMAALRRKTLMTCKECHKAIHAGRHRIEWDNWKNKLESRVQ
jgi:group II intron reverse transcriptase/maturase